MIAKFRSNGQTCVCANRFYVQAGVCDLFAKKLPAKVRELLVGNGFAPGVTTGPLINAAALAKVESHISHAVATGAKVTTGGNRIGGAGTFFAPSVLCDVTPAMQVCHEETFGPVAALVRFDTEAEVIASANAANSASRLFLQPRSGASLANGRSAGKRHGRRQHRDHLDRGHPHWRYQTIRSRARRVEIWDRGFPGDQDVMLWWHRLKLIADGKEPSSLWMSTTRYLIVGKPRYSASQRRKHCPRCRLSWASNQEQFHENVGRPDQMHIRSSPSAGVRRR
jgi:Aldehyde dehydrogenase family